MKNILEVDFEIINIVVIVELKKREVYDFDMVFKDISYSGSNVGLELLFRKEFVFDGFKYSFVSSM